jgi:peptidoglycan glycosyltransferase
MLDTVIALLNGESGAEIVRVTRVAFYVLLAVCCGAFVITSRPTGGSWRAFFLLKLLVAAALLGVLGYQAGWQVAGFRKPEFVAFMRRYNQRPDAAGRLVKRGTIYDCMGVKLAESVADEPWGRAYPLGAAAAHVVGYYHPRYGIAGLERAADPQLAGYGMATRRERERFGRNLLDRQQAEGLHLALTLDARLQQKAYDLLAGRRGAVVVLRPGDGTILALASSPAFDPADPAPALQDAEAAPMLNRALHGRYPPGSTFKVLVAAMAAAQKKAPVFDCPGAGFAASPHASPIRDSAFWAYERQGRVWPGYGRIGLRDGFVRSSNVYFAQLGLACGADRFNTVAAAAHINERVSVFAGADGGLRSFEGNLPPVTRQDRAAVAQLAIGQGPLLVTPLHVAMFTGAIAADGVLWQPRLDAREEPRPMNRITTPAAAATVAALMRETVLSGTGRDADIPGLAVCGKTGTAEAAGGDDHAWFTCFAPQDQARLVVTVIIERGGFGAEAALPVARGLLQEAVRIGVFRPKGADRNAEH